MQPMLHFDGNYYSDSIGNQTAKESCFHFSGHEKKPSYSPNDSKMGHLKPINCRKYFLTRRKKKPARTRLNERKYHQIPWNPSDFNNVNKKGLTEMLLCHPDLRPGSRSSCELMKGGRNVWSGLSHLQHVEQQRAELGALHHEQRHLLTQPSGRGGEAAVRYGRGVDGAHHLRQGLLGARGVLRLLHEGGQPLLHAAAVAPHAVQQLHQPVHVLGAAAGRVMAPAVLGGGGEGGGERREETRPEWRSTVWRVDGVCSLVSWISNVQLFWWGSEGSKSGPWT